MDKCPKCNSSWQGEPIPEEDRKYYREGTTHYSRMIGIDGGLMGIYDGLVAIRCPDCGEDFPRNNSTWALEMYNKYKEVINENKAKS